MALASPTEVPPNFMTMQLAISFRNPTFPKVRKDGAPSKGKSAGGIFQISLRFEQLGIEQCRASSATYGVVREQSKFPVEHSARAKSPDGGGHASAELNIKTRLWAIYGIEISHWNFRSGRELLLLRNAAEFLPCFQNLSD